MTESVDNIPTLTDIIQVGDQSMLNHFDAHQFDNTQTESHEELPQDSIENTNDVVMEDVIEASNIMESAAMFESPEAELKEIPSIRMDDEQDIDIEDEDFSDAMELINDDKFDSNSKTTPSKGTQFDNDILREKINQAVNEILPGIEIQLKEQLYKQFDL